jgi:uncharacterized membrane protein YfhO
VSFLVSVSFLLSVSRSSIDCIYFVMERCVYLATVFPLFLLCTIVRVSSIRLREKRVHSIITIISVYQKQLLEFKTNKTTLGPRGIKRTCARSYRTYSILRRWILELGRFPSYTSN